MKLPLKLKRYKLIEAHQQLVRSGHFHAARMILHFLQSGSITLHLDDASWEVELLLEKIGFHLHPDRRGWTSWCLVSWK